MYVKSYLYLFMYLNVLKVLQPVSISKTNCGDPTGAAPPARHCARRSRVSRRALIIISSLYKYWMTVYCVLPVPSVH